jgi:hypothetical protein
VNALWIWLAATAIYLGFRAWYDSWRGPLRPEEIETYLKRIEASDFTDAKEVEILRGFMEEDDGREFVMLNLVRLDPKPASHPETGEPTPARDLLRGYPGTPARDGFSRRSPGQRSFEGASSRAPLPVEPDRDRIPTW